VSEFTQQMHQSFIPILKLDHELKTEVSKNRDFDNSCRCRTIAIIISRVECKRVLCAVK